MKNGLTTLIALAALLSAPSVCAEGAGIEWDILNDEVKELYRTGQYARAVVVGKKALKVAEEIVGPDHPDVAASLNNLALLYDTQGQYAAAEPLYKLALSIEAWSRQDRPGSKDAALWITDAAFNHFDGYLTEVCPVYPR